jgi:D-glycero-alpha-D-manno-heptose-7-phosphate kinase
MIITRAPLRIPLGGGGTDLPSYYSEYGGFILSAAIDKFVFINVNRPKTDDAIRLKYSETEIVRSIEEVRHPLFRESLRYLNVEGNIEIASLADVPAGTGLGSSGSFLVSLLAALHTLQRRHLSTQQLAEAACDIEIQRAAQPVGKHDQYLAAYGGLTCLEIDKDGAVEVRPLSISAHSEDELRNNLLVFFTGIVRRSFDILQQQQQATVAGDKSVVDSLHLTKDIGLQVKAALEAGNLDWFGELLDTHWQNKKRRSGKISDPRLDEVYDDARKNGALGGKLMGAGGGGFFLFYCPNGKKGRLRDAMAKHGLREMPFAFDHEGAKVLVNL